MYFMSSADSHTVIYRLSRLWQSSREMPRSDLKVLVTHQRQDSLFNQSRRSSINLCTAIVYESETPRYEQICSANDACPFIISF